MHHQTRNRVILIEYQALQARGYKAEMITEMLAYKYYLSPNRIFAIVKEELQTPKQV